MIGLVNISGAERVSHYPHPRPVVERNDRELRVVLKTNHGSPAKNIEATHIHKKRERRLLIRYDAFFIGADMMDENGRDSHSTLASPAPAATPAARGRRDALRAGTVVPVALGLMLGIAYLGYANVQRQIKAQHAELQSLKDKFQAMASAQSRTGVEQSPPSISEIQGLQNHVDTLRGRAKKQKK